MRGPRARVDAVVGREADDTDARDAVRAKIVGEWRWLVLGRIGLGGVVRGECGIRVDLRIYALRKSDEPSWR